MKQTLKILLLLVVVCTSCTSNEERLRLINEKADNMPRVVSEESRLRDKTYIEYTVREWINNGYKDYHYFINDYTPENRAKAKIHVADIFYSPDSLKIFSFIVTEEPINLSLNEWNKKVSKTDLCFDGGVVVGIRENPKEPWKMYCFSQILPVGFTNKEKVKLLLRIHFFEKFKSESFAGFKENGEWGFCSFKYNLDEPEFWTGPAFDKSCFMGEGYYFQIDDFRSPEYIKGKRDTVPFFKIDYPKELIEQFDK